MQFLDLFTYESIEKLEQNSLYNNCTVLRDFGKYKAQQHIDGIIMYLNLHIWEKDNYIDEVVLLL